ncbi:MAG: dihydrofolate reductase family protein [Chloroflexota bacterium]|nr:dihydrofolate reductase family protein [Lentimicrobium sp.]
MSESREKQGKTTLYIASSVDGYIAGPNDDLSFLSIAEIPGEDYGYAEFMEGIDVVITGRTTYEWVKEHASNYVHNDKEAYIITHDPETRIEYPLITLEEIFDDDQPQKRVRTFTGDLGSLVSLLKSQGKRIFIEGGANIIHQLMQHNLIDEYFIATVPILLGSGTRLFTENYPEQKLELIEVLAYETSLVMMHYIRVA